MTRMGGAPVLGRAQGDRYSAIPVTEPRGRARVRWGDLLAGLDGPGGLGELGGFELTGDPDVEVDAITHDSRRVEPGACFACIPGARTDGHDHAPEAVARGAVALLVERPLPLAVSQARVPSVRAALGPLAATLHGHPSAAMRVLGVTGTNGKTTTTYLLEAIGRDAGERVGVIGTVGARIAGQTVATEHTTPEASDLQELLARMRDAAVATVAMEVSSHALEQHRVDGVQFAAVCFTNLSHEHLDYHGSLDAYFEAKARLFDPRRARSAAVNLDDPRGVELAARVRATDLDLWTFAVDDDSADVTAETPSFAPDGTASTLVDRRAGSASRCTSPSSVRSTSPTHSLPRPRRGRPASPSPRSPTGWRSPWSYRAASSGSTPASPSPCWSTTPTRPMPSAACWPPPAPSPAPAGGWCASSGAGATATPPSAR